MVVSSAQLDLFLSESRSLKDKRYVVKSLIARIRGKFNVSVSEVGHNDLWQRSLIGVVIVSNDEAFASSVLEKVVDFVELDGRVQLLDYSVEAR